MTTCNCIVFVWIWRRNPQKTECQYTKLLHVKEPQIIGKVDIKFKGPIQITGVFQNSANLMNPNMHLTRNITFDRLKHCFE